MSTAVSAVALLMRSLYSRCRRVAEKPSSPPAVVSSSTMYRKRPCCSLNSALFYAADVYRLAIVTVMTRVSQSYFKRLVARMNAPSAPSRPPADVYLVTRFIAIFLNDALFPMWMPGATLPISTPSIACP